MAELILILEPALAIAAVAAPAVTLVALLCLVAARTWAAPPTADADADPQARWQLDR